jgi:UDP-N-acetylglucosamine acyltransferase
MTATIHPTAILARGVELGQDVTIGPYSVIGEGVRIGDRTHIAEQVLIGPLVTIGNDNRIGAKVNIVGRTTIGDGNAIHGLASLGTPPQDFSYQGEETCLEIGDGNTIREFVTVNRGTVKGGGVTRIGNHCLLMACCHVAHDCEIEDRVILGNNALLAGHVRVGTRANISGGAGAHHFVSIGPLAYVGGLSRLVQDVPPFMIVEGHPSRVRGVNVVGLARAGHAEDAIERLRDAYKQIYRSKEREPRRRLLERVKAESGGDDLVGRLVSALQDTELGPKGRYRETLKEEFARRGRELLLARQSEGAATGSER